MRTANPPPFIAGRGRRHYVGGMFRALASLVVALALLLAPFGMPVSGHGAAHAAAPAAATMAHPCADVAPEQAPGEHPSRLGIDCAIACAAVPAADADAPDPVKRQAVPLRPMTDSAMDGIRPEGETPPPRIASET